ncbi:hypothetical protein ABIA24_000885 [Sinorhizobium fredii]
MARVFSGADNPAGIRNHMIIISKKIQVNGL